MVSLLMKYLFILNLIKSILQETCQISQESGKALQEQLNLPITKPMVSIKAV